MTGYGKLPDIGQPSHAEESYEDARQKIRVGWLVKHSVGTVLDIGCAEGYILAEIDHPNCCGVDFDQNRINAGKKKYPDIRFYVIDVRYGLPFTDESFDTVLLAEILEHMDFMDSMVLLAEAVRIARAKVLITLPYAGGEEYDPELVCTRDHLWIPDADHVGRLLSDYPSEVELKAGFAMISLPKRK